MVVLALHVALYLPGCRSLKDRRRLVRPVVEGARERFRVSAADLGGADRWHRAELGFAVVSGSHAHARDVMDEVERFVWSFPEIEVLETGRTWLEEP